LDLIKSLFEEYNPRSKEPMAFLFLDKTFQNRVKNRKLYEPKQEIGSGTNK
jgi:hypothetical protein